MDGRALSRKRASMDKDEKHLLQYTKFHNRERYSMNYNSYEAAIIDPEEKKVRMLQYTFPGYKLRSMKDYQEGATQTHLSIHASLPEGENAKLKQEMSLEECKPEVAVETAVKEAKKELKIDKNERGSLAAHGWVGPPLIVKMRINDFLFIEITPVALPPVLLRLNKGAIDHHTLEISVVPGPQFVPQVVVMISGLEIYPHNQYNLLSVNKSLARRPIMFIDSGRNTQVKTGGRWLGKKDGMQNLAMAECMLDQNQPEEEEVEDEGFDMPQSWLQLHYDKMQKVKEYHLNKYKLEKGTDVSPTSVGNPLKVLFERDYEPSYKHRSPKQMKKFHLENKLMYSKHFIYSPHGTLNNRDRTNSITKAHAATSHMAFLKRMVPLNLVPSGEELDYIEADPKATRGRRGTFYPQNEVYDTPLSEMDEPTNAGLPKINKITIENKENEKKDEVVSDVPVPKIERSNSSKVTWTHNNPKREHLKSVLLHRESMVDMQIQPLVSDSPKHGRTTSEEYALARINRYLHARGASPVSPSPHGSQPYQWGVEEDQTVTDRLKRGIDKLGQTINEDRKSTTLSQKSFFGNASRKSFKSDESDRKEARGNSLYKKKSTISVDSFKTAKEMSEAEDKNNKRKTPQKRKKSLKRHSSKDRPLPTIKEESPAFEKSPKKSFTDMALGIQKEMSPIRDEINSLRDKMAKVRRSDQQSEVPVTIAKENELRKSLPQSLDAEPIWESRHSAVSVFLEPPSPQTSSISGDENQPEKKKGVKRFYQRFTKKK
ncbi:uncharacterized protein LOC106663120 [Cimex lectularius]|uniref:Uncharacterized protein n=1 Tax=Cimex lectularius TaxID=79782 RepID=A0A8I6RG15_CIMLE|nr:uncharacterized protein LOC106663120 [Cimex lectularius]